MSLVLSSCHLESDMGSKASSPSPVVCCMCGDQGLSQELFRCKLCLVRSQHKYCSDLYPKANSYRACNWCLRKEGPKVLAKEAAQESKSSNFSPDNSESSNEVSNPHRGAFSSQLNKPVKKQLRPLHRSAPDVTDRMRPTETSPRSGGDRQVFRA